MALTPGEIEYIKRLRKEGANDESVLYYLEKRREKEAQMNAPQEKGIIGKIVETGQNIGAGAIQAGGELAVGLPGQISRLLPGDQSADPNSFYNKTQRLLGKTKEEMAQEGVETEGAGFGFGKGVINIAGGSVIGGGLGKVLDPIAKSKYLTQLGLKVSGALPTATKYAAPVLKGALTGAKEGLGFDLASGNAPGVGTVAGAVTGGVSPIVGAGFEKVKSLLTNTLPKSLIARGMTTPSALRNASERLSKLSDDGIIDIEKAPEWMLQKGLGGSKKEIQSQLANIIKNSGETKRTLLSSSTQGLGSVPEVKSLQSAMKSVLGKYAKVTKNGKSVVPTPGNEELVKVIQSFVNNKNPTAVEVEKARSLLGNMQIFTKLGDFADSASKEGLQKVWVNISKYLDNAFPGFRNVNKDIEVAMALSKAIGLKEAQDSVKNLLTFTNLGMGGLGATYGYTQGGGEGAIAGLLLATGGKALLNNPAVTTKTAQALSSPVFKQGLKKGGEVIGKTIKKTAPAITSKIYE